MNNTLKHILIVDDNNKNLQVTAKILKDQGYLINLAQNGSLALQLLENYTPDLILLDVMMPEMDGYETCRRIKSLDNLKEIPIIFLTAKNETEDLLEGFQAGGIDYITKPFNREELLIRVKNHIELADSRQKIINMNKTRDKLYSIIAHDIQSPVNNIKMLIQAVRDGIIEPGSDDFQEIMTSLDESTSDTLVLLKNLLKWTEIQKESIVVHPQLMEVRPLLEDCVKLLSGNARNKNIQIDLSIVPSGKAYFDEVSVHTVFRNLISNAIKFTPQNGQIEILGDQDAEYFHINIKDNGNGINEDILEKILRHNEPHTSIGTNQERGTGLGLMLVKDFTAKNFGLLNMKSKIGEGTEAIVSLPLKPKK